VAGTVVSAIVSTVVGAVTAVVLAQLGNPLIAVPIVLLLIGAGVMVYKNWDSWRLVVLGGVVGLLLGLLVPYAFDLLKPSPLSPPALPPASNASAAIHVTSPRKVLECTNPEKDPACLFEVKGKATGIDPADLRIYTFVYPTDPPGEGWYMQVQPATVSGDGQWVQTPSYLGNERARVRTGHSLRLRAAVVGRDATYKGTRLSDLRPGEALPAVEDIEGIVARSESVQLTVKR